MQSLAVQRRGMEWQSTQRTAQKRVRDRARSGAAADVTAGGAHLRGALAQRGDPAVHLTLTHGDLPTTLCCCSPFAC